MILMKKAYVKVKTPSAKTILKRPYIAATIIGAAVCAIILSLTISPEQENTQEESLSSVLEIELRFIICHMQLIHYQ